MGSGMVECISVVLVAHSAAGDLHRVLSSLEPANMPPLSPQTCASQRGDPLLVAGLSLSFPKPPEWSPTIAYSAACLDAAAHCGGMEGKDRIGLSRGPWYVKHRKVVLSYFYPTISYCTCWWYTCNHFDKLRTLLLNMGSPVLICPAAHDSQAATAASIQCPGWCQRFWGKDAAWVMGLLTFMLTI